MITSVWLLASVISLSSVFVSSQYGNFEMYDRMPQNYHFNPYSNNPFMNPPQIPENSDNQVSRNFQQPSTISSSCEDYWSVLSDYYETYGLLTVPSPDFRTIVIRVILSVAAQLPTVSPILSF